jgi:aspartate/methionine/tyrosine aminotransferase
MTLGEKHGIAVVAGVTSQAGANWVRFSYALPPENRAAAIRLFEGLKSLK